MGAPPPNPRPGRSRLREPARLRCRTIAAAGVPAAPGGPSLAAQAERLRHTPTLQLRTAGFRRSRIRRRLHDGRSTVRSLRAEPKASGYTSPGMYGFYLVGVLGLALLMVLHEGGHFLAARAFGMRVTR